MPYASLPWTENSISLDIGTLSEGLSPFESVSQSEPRLTNFAKSSLTSSSTIQVCMGSGRTTTTTSLPRFWPPPLAWLIVFSPLRLMPETWRRWRGTWRTSIPPIWHGAVASETSRRKKGLDLFLGREGGSPSVIEQDGGPRVKSVLLNDLDNTDKWSCHSQVLGLVCSYPNPRNTTSLILGHWQTLPRNPFTRWFKADHSFARGQSVLSQDFRDGSSSTLIEFLYECIGNTLVLTFFGDAVASKAVFVRKVIEVICKWFNYEGPCCNRQGCISNARNRSNLFDRLYLLQSFFPKALSCSGDAHSIHMVYLMNTTYGLGCPRSRYKLRVASSSSLWSSFTAENLFLFSC